MKFGYLRDSFTDFAWKRVTAVEVDPESSNGHELNSSSRLREILGETTRRASQQTGISTRFFYFNDEEDAPTEDVGSLSWYESRANQPKRSPEWRLYYTDNAVIGRTGHAKSGDFFLIAFSPGKNSAYVFVAASKSTAESQIKWLFGISETQELKFQTGSVRPEQPIGFAAAKILEAVGVVLPTTDDPLLEEMLSKFGEKFPPSSVFSNFVRSRTPAVPAEENADAAIIAWMESEEFAFRVLERFLVEKRIKSGFKDVDDFVTCSLSVQNRRKSRAGRAFENHLAEIFTAHKLIFERGGLVEDNGKPDFLFPGSAHYFDQKFPSANLTILGAKTSCKDRCRQVLAEGRRIKEN